MSVKSTVHLTQMEAIEKYAKLKVETMKHTLMAEALLMTPTELEDKLEQMNDEAHGGEGFENYSIDGGWY